MGLELRDPGFDYSVLCASFGLACWPAGAEERLLSAHQTRGLIKAGSRQRTDSTHVVAVIRQLNRLDLVGEGLRYARNELVQVTGAGLVGDRGAARLVRALRSALRLLPSAGVPRETLGTGTANRRGV